MYESGVRERGEQCGGLGLVEADERRAQVEPAVVPGNPRDHLLEPRDGAVTLIGFRVEWQ